MGTAGHVLGTLIGIGEVVVFSGLAAWALWKALAPAPDRPDDDDLLNEKQ